MNTIDRITSYVAGLGALLTAGSFVVSTSVGIGALAGAAVSIADFIAIRWIASRMMKAGEKARAILSLVLVGKMSLLLGGCAAILFYGRVNALGFMVGIGAMVLGVFFGGIHEHLGAPDEPQAGSSPPAAPQAVSSSPATPQAVSFPAAPQAVSSPEGE